ncbi:MAG: DUF742 domain-containing protein [Bifidobacteriaceae bacterium]|nr:DUF742 domain-containing protein [Bifidobacteriaceae bacterium]
MTPEPTQANQANQARPRPGRETHIAERSFDTLANPANVHVPPPGVNLEPPPRASHRGERPIQVQRRRPGLPSREIPPAEPVGAVAAAGPAAHAATRPPSASRPAPAPAPASGPAPPRPPAASAHQPQQAHQAQQAPAAAGPPAQQAPPAQHAPQAASGPPSGQLPVVRLRREPPRRTPDAEADEVSSVRPFVVTRGRTQASLETRLESILEVANQQWEAEKGKQLSPEELAIVRQIATTYLTVAEVSAHLKLPVGVVKVLVSDLAESGVLLVHDTVAGGGGINAGGVVTREQTLELLESVLNAISEL